MMIIWIYKNIDLEYTLEISFVYSDSQAKMYKADQPNAQRG